jgi:tetratricopeptide (TPR) repeat protein
MHGRGAIAKAVIVAHTVLLMSITLAELLRQHQTHPNDAELCQRIGVAYLQERQLQPAAEFFRKTLILAPESIPARKNLGTALWFLNEHDASEREFSRVLRSAPRDPVANLYTGLRAYERRDYVTAAARLEAAGELAAANPEVRPIWLESLLGAAEHHDRAGRPEAAYEMYRKALSAFPDSDDAYVALSGFAAAHGNNDYARKVVDRGLARLPNSAKLLFEGGIILALDGKLDQSAAGFSRAQKREPAWAPATMALGIVELQRSQFAQAAKSFQKSAKLASGDWRPEYLYALSLHKSGDANSISEAMRSLERAIHAAPREAKPHTLLGQILLSQGRTGDAVNELEKAHSLSPDDATTLYQLSLAYRKQGRADEAARMMQGFQSVKAKSRGEDAELIQILKVPNR